MAKRERVSEAGFEFRMPVVPAEHIRFIEAQEEGLQIDEHGLEEELQSQVPSYYEVSKRLSVEVSRRDAAKHYLKTVEARVDGDLRREAKAAGDKVTETVIENRRILVDDVIAATQILLDAESRVRDLTTLKEAFTQRSYVLKDLVALYIANYYSGTEAERGERAARSISAETAKRATKERLRRE